MYNNDELFALLRLDVAAQCLIYSLDKSDSELRTCAFLELRKAIKELNSLRGYDFDAKSSAEEMLKAFEKIK